MQPRIILDSKRLALTIDRLCYQLIENHKDFENSAIVGIQPRGIYLAQRIHSRLKAFQPGVGVPLGILDITFYRDDFRRRDKPIEAKDTVMNFTIEGKKVILVDDVLYTGRTIRSAMDALLDFGRPEEVELLVLIDRRFRRHVPIEANYVGKTVDSIDEERVKVEWNGVEDHTTDQVWILNTKEVTS